MWISVLTLALLLPSISATSVVRGSSSCEAISVSSSLVRSHSIRHLQDRALKQVWEVRKDCEHPAGPGKLASVGVDASFLSPSLIVPDGPLHERQFISIHAGDRVTLIRETSTMHLALQGISLEDGGDGARVRVRLLRGQTVLWGSIICRGRVTLMPNLDPSFQQLRESQP